MSEWDYLWTPDEGLCSTAEIFMKAPDYAYVISPWLEKVKAEGDKLQDTLNQIRQQCHLSMHSPIRGRSHLAKTMLMILDGSEFTTKDDNDAGEG